MFTGIIESIGEITHIYKKEGNILFTVKSELSEFLKIDQSVSHNGACLTVVETKDQSHQVEAVAETLSKTNLGSLKLGETMNLERAMLLNDRLDGHLVQGHVDTTGVCIERSEQGGSTLFSFNFPERFAALIIEKGSVTVNGISLTVFHVRRDRFSVAVIPYTLEHTTMKYLEEKEKVNIEFDLIGKYVLRREELQSLF